MNSLPLENKKIFITGGSRGIGAAIVQRLVEKGAQVAFTYSSNEESARKLLESLPQSAKHRILAMNVADEASVQQGVEKIMEEWPEIDGVVNNAGITKDQLLMRLKADDFQSVLDTNLKGSFLVTKAFIRPMLKARKGSIVNITSVIGQTGNAGQSNYAASKAGTEAFSKSVALEVASRGIRVNCVAPGFIRTDMTDKLTEDQKKAILSKVPMERIAEAVEVADAVAFLLSDESRYITGHTLSVNGGLFMS